MSGPRIEFEIWQGDEMLAGVSGPFEVAVIEADRYLAQYREDGPVEVWQVTRSKIHTAFTEERSDGS